MSLARRTVLFSLLPALALSGAALALSGQGSGFLHSAAAQDRKGGDRKEDPPKKGGDKDGEKGDKGGRAGKDDTRKDDAKKGEGKEEKKRLVEGDEVKDLSLELLEGGSWTASSARGKAVVLVFASEFSAESLEALKSLGDAKGRTAKSGASVLGVLRDADAEKAKKVVKDRSLTVALALDPRRKAYDRLARAGLPWTVVLDRAGKIVLSTGGFDDESVAKKVEELAKK